MSAKNSVCAGLTAAVGFMFGLHGFDAWAATESVIYSFQGQPDGWYPTAGLVDVNGMLYGTTARGGSSGCNGLGCGTIFSVDPSTGAETVVYSFCSRRKCADGASPNASLTDVNGVLYGTTRSGGTQTNCSDGGPGGVLGCGIVYALSA